MSSTFEPKWTPGKWSFVIRGYFDSGDEIWSLGNEDDPIQFPVADFDAGGEPYPNDRELIALAPELAAAVLAVDQWYRDNQQHVPECNAGGSLGALGTLAERLRMIGADDTGKCYCDTDDSSRCDGTCTRMIGADE